MECKALAFPNTVRGTNRANPWHYFVGSVVRNVTHSRFYNMAYAP